MKTFDIHHMATDYRGNGVVMSYEIRARSWEEAEKAIPAGHWVDGEIIGYMDEKTGVLIEVGGHKLN